MSEQRYLTKSRFKLALECPTKLYYTKKKEYPDNKVTDPFLRALAEGGYQVGELAKQYFPGGHDITTLDYEEAEKETYELLQKEDVIIYEPAIRFENLFIRIDVLVKKGKHFELYEVKAKSFDNDAEQPFLNKNGTIKAKWAPYLYDVAFQRYVLSEAFPDYSVTSFLMLSDKRAPSPTEGLNQKFRIVRDESNVTGIKVSVSLTDEDLKERILIKVQVDQYVDQIIEGTDTKEPRSQSFAEFVGYFCDHYLRDEKIASPLGAKCKKCEFYCSQEQEAQGKISGFKECWKSSLGWGDEDFSQGTVLDIWNLRADKLIQQGVTRVGDVTEDDIKPKPDEKAGLSASERQWLQVEKAKNQDITPYIDVPGLRSEIGKLAYPLHFIDFETTTVTIPFNKGRVPYETVAFQFSHHEMTEEGEIVHVGEFINTVPGKFPNYDFLRALKTELSKDEGSIFRYSYHENTVLNQIYRQLKADLSPPEDAEELSEFIKAITKSIKDSTEKWEGPRSMIDLALWVKRYYYDPATGGSNSIKDVLPAILASSEYLQSKYSQPIYGASGGVKSHNFTDWQWIEVNDGVVTDPYKLLPKMFADVSDEDFELLSYEDELTNGGAALTAYARLQFSELSDYEREELTAALLKYCELDTFAMVMIFEAWKEMVS